MFTDYLSEIIQEIQAFKGFKDDYLVYWIFRMKVSHHSGMKVSHPAWV